MKPQNKRCFFAQERQHIIASPYKLIIRLIQMMLAVVIMLSLGACQSANANAIPLQPISEALANDTTIQLNLIAVGDNLIHGPIYRQARERTTDGSFDFRPAYQYIVPYLEQADLALINQETPLGGTQLGLSSYPMFNSPQELGDQLIELGFNMISHANNHVLDARQQGFFNTIEFWRSRSLQKPVIMAGIAADASDDQLQILEVKNLKVDLLAYTYGTNGLKLPASSSGIVKYINDDLMQQELAEAKAAADIVIVSIHWGQEYQTNANAEQKRIAQLLADNGADIIIGSHPHVLQGVEMLTVNASEQNSRQVPVFYSLGNFISAQNRPDTMLGGMAKIQMSYDLLDKSISFTEIGVIPLVTDYTGSYKNITVYPLSAYTPEQAKAHGVHRSYSNFSLEYLQKLFAERIPQEFQIY